MKKTGVKLVPEVRIRGWSVERSFVRGQKQRSGRNPAGGESLAAHHRRRTHSESIHSRHPRTAHRCPATSQTSTDLLHHNLLDVYILRQFNLL